PGGPPLLRTLSSDYRLCQRVPLLCKRLDNSLVQLPCTRRCPLCELHTRIDQISRYLSGSVHRLGTVLDQSNRFVVLLVCEQLLGKLLGVLDIEKEPGHLHLSTDPSDLVLDLYKVSRGPRHHIDQLREKDRREDHVHTGVEQVRLVPEIDRLKDLALGCASLGSHMLHRVLDVVCYICVDQSTSQIRQRVPDPTLFQLPRICQMRQDLCIPDLVPVHRDTARLLKRDDVVRSVLEHEPGDLHNRLTGNVCVLIPQLNRDHPGFSLGTELDQSNPERIREQIQPRRLGIDRDGLLVPSPCQKLGDLAVLFDHVDNAIYTSYFLGNLDH